MLTYEPGQSLFHRLDPRTKLALQAGFALAAFSHPTPRGLAVLSALALSLLAAARTSPTETLGAYRFALPFLVAAPLIEMIRLGPPWIAPAAGVPPALASYRVLLILLVSAAYVRTTPVRDSRAAVQRLIPGRPGQFLGLGIAFVFRFLPVLRADLRSVRDATAARLGTERPVTARIRILTTAGVGRAFDRADTFSLALRARCFAWNPTLPALRFRALDLPGLALAVGLGLSAFW